MSNIKLEQAIGLASPYVARHPVIIARTAGPLNRERYINILSDCAVLSAHSLRYGNNFVLQDDGAPCHRARNEWKLEQGIKTHVWHLSHQTLTLLRIFGETLRKDCAQ